MNRAIVLHCHFFKNAGTSIDWALRRNFGLAFHENKQHFYSVSDWNTHLQGVVADHSIHAISSHIFSLLPPAIDGVTFHVLAMCRHPIERVTSVAAYEKKQNYRNSLGTITDTEIGLQDYVQAYLKDGTPASIRNMHTLRFAGRDNGRPVTEEDFAKALLTAEQCQTIGVVEFFDESMVLFEERLRPVFPNLNLAYVIQNVHQKPQSIDSRVQTLRGQLGEELFEGLLSKNMMDIKLYDLVKERFQQRIKAIPDFVDKLEKFRGRCRDLYKEIEAW